MYDRITTNLIGAKKRTEILDGKKYTVVPTVMIMEGVWAGNKGPFYYSNDELGKFPETWNHKPIVVDHPTFNGNGISACDPKVVSERSIGLLFNTVHNDKLRTESWIEDDKANKVDPSILIAINKGQTVEVSTGMYHDVEETPGTWNGKDFIASVKNIRPDHLAILPNKVGACSTLDGAGLLQNAAGEVAYSDIQEQIRALLRKDAQAEVDGGYPAYTYVMDVFPKYVVFERNSSYYKIGYKTKDGKVSLVGEPENVVRLTSYVTANQINQEPIPMANSITKNTVAVAPERAAAVGLLIADKGWVEDDRGFLETLPDTDFQRVTNYKPKVVIPAPATVVTTPPGFQTPAAAMQAAAVIPSLNEAQKVVTAEEYVKQAPPEIRELLANGLAAQVAQKNALIERITSNKSNVFTKEYLATLATPQLQGIAALASPVTNQTQHPAFAGQAEVPMFLTRQPTANSTTPQTLPVLELPTMNWADDEKQAG